MEQQARASFIKVCILSPDEAAREDLALGAARANYHVDGKFSDARRLLDFISAAELAHIIVVDMSDPIEEQLQLIKELYARRPLPIVAVARERSKSLAVRAIEAGAQSFIIKPVRAEDLEIAFGVAVAQQAKQSRLESEIRLLNTRLTERKIIERAKGILMDSAKLTEAEAFRLMQKQSQSESRPMVEIAKAIISTEQLVRQAMSARKS